MVQAMTKIGRNDPCPCGSGRKFKHCCLKNEEAAEREALAALNEAIQERGRSRPQFSDVMKLVDRLAAQYDDDLELTNTSNAAIDLVRAGKLDQAEQAARDLLVRYPDVHDGYDRLGMVYEARGDNKQAAYYYRKVIDLFASIPTSTTQNLRLSFTGSSPSSTHRPPTDSPIHLITSRGCASARRTTARDQNPWP